MAGVFATEGGSYLHRALVSPPASGKCLEVMMPATVLYLLVFEQHDLHLAPSPRRVPGVLTEVVGLTNVKLRGDR